jgi:branched-chain amino acid transport system ATP-binding protein
VLEVKAINSFYGHYRALYDVSLEVPEGGFVIVLGPNGHGKSTLLHTICGLHRAASGSVRSVASSTCRRTATCSPPCR